MRSGRLSMQRAKPRLFKHGPSSETTITGVICPVIVQVMSSSRLWGSRSRTWRRASSIDVIASRVVCVAVTGPASTSLVA